MARSRPVAEEARDRAGDLRAKGVRGITNGDED